MNGHSVQYSNRLCKNFGDVLRNVGYLKRPLLYEPAQSDNCWKMLAGANLYLAAAAAAKFTHSVFFFDLLRRDCWKRPAKDAAKLNNGHWSGKCLLFYSRARVIRDQFNLPRRSAHSFFTLDLPTCAARGWLEGDQMCGAHIYVK